MTSPAPLSLQRTLGLFLAAVCLVGGLVALFLFYGATPKSTKVGFSPPQPLPFSHKLHVGQLKMDCVACHSGVFSSPHAGMPDAQSCLACHTHILPEKESLQKLHRAASPNSPFYTGESLTWQRVNRLPDYAVFSHAAHVNRGVGCVSCHGDVSKQERLSQTKSLSMSWCLECHKNPAPELRPLESITSPLSAPEAMRQALEKLEGKPLSPQELEEKARQLQKSWRITPRSDCSACHH